MGLDTAPVEARCNEYKLYLKVPTGIAGLKHS